VSYKRFDVKDITNASRMYYLVWGANADNWRGKTGEPIEGGGMAEAMKSHKEGIYGIITTPYLPKDEINTPNVLTSIVKYNYIWDMVKSNIAIEINKKKTEPEKDKYKYDLYKALVLSKYSSTKDGLKLESEAEGIILKIRGFLNISYPQHQQVINELNTTIADQAIKKQIAEEIKKQEKVKLPVIYEDDDGKADGKAAKEKAGEDDKKDEEDDGEAKAKAKAEDDEEEEEEKDEEDDGKADEKAEEVARSLINSFKKSPFLRSAKIVETLNKITREIREADSEDAYVKLTDGKITINF
jgi:hypothetical protein